MNSLFNTADTWQPIIDNARDALRINMFIVDAKGSPIYFSTKGNRYGWKMSREHFMVNTIFKKRDYGHFEWTDPYGLFYHAVEIKDEACKTAGYIVLGPVVLNKRLLTQEFCLIATECQENSEECQERLEEIRVISHLNFDSLVRTIDAILNMSHHMTTIRNDISKRDQRNITILESMFYISVAITNSESGSLMLFDDQTKELFISMAKGIGQNYLRVRAGLDQSISGFAFTEQRTLVLKGRFEPKNLEGMLNRSEILESLIVPFEGPNKTIRGVLNLNRLSSKPDELLSISRQISQLVKDVLQTV